MLKHLYPPGRKIWNKLSFIVGLIIIQQINYLGDMNAKRWLQSLFNLCFQNSHPSFLYCSLHTPHISTVHFFTSFEKYLENTETLSLHVSFLWSRVYEFIWNYEFHMINCGWRSLDVGNKLNFTHLKLCFATASHNFKKAKKYLHILT